MDATLVAMAMMQGLTSAIVNPCDLRLMETIIGVVIFQRSPTASSYVLPAERGLAATVTTLPLAR